jgi:hypothetical protein
MLFLNSFYMKNIKLTNLDILYLKIYKCSVAIFWTCGVLCHT